MDITDIPMARGFFCLAAVLDGFPRRVLAGRVSITLEADFCIEAVEDALARLSSHRFDCAAGHAGQSFARVHGPARWRDGIRLAPVPV